MRKVKRGEAADHHGADRQGHVPEIVEDLVDRPQRAPVVGYQAAQGKPLEVAAAGEQHDQQQGEQEAGMAFSTISVVELETSKREPSRTALAMPSGIEMK